MGSRHHGVEGIILLPFPGSPHKETTHAEPYKDAKK